MTAPPAAPRRWSRRLWLVYWLALFVATHVPPSSAARWSFHIADWILHASSFALLGLLTARAVVRMRPAGSSGSERVGIPWGVGLWYLVLMAYAAVDEWTQPLTGRRCELRDWLADLCGVGAGLLMGYAWHVLRSGRPAGDQA